MYEIGKTQDNPDAKGLAFIMHPKIKDCVTQFKTYSKRVTEMGINLQGKDSVSVINAYAPISSAEDENMEQFYDDIERAMADSDSNYQSLQEISMQKMELKQEEDFKSMGAFKIEERNESGTAVQGLRFLGSGLPQMHSRIWHPVHVTDFYATESRTPLVRELSADRFLFGLFPHCSPPTSGQNGGRAKVCGGQEPLCSAASVEKKHIFFPFRLQPTRHHYYLAHNIAHTSSVQSTK